MQSELNPGQRPPEELFGLLTETEAALAATRVELSTVKAELAALKTGAGAATGTAAASEVPAEAGVDVCVLPELSFLSPRGKFVPTLSTVALTLTGKSATVVIPLQLMRCCWVLPDPATKGVLFAATLSTSVANGKQRVSCVTLASKGGEKPISLSLGGGDSSPISAVPAEALALALSRTVKGLVSSSKPVALQCYHKASEACLYVCDAQLVVREGGKIFELPHAATRAELLPPSGRRTFDIQFECSAAEGACAAPLLKMELSMIPADEFSGVAAKLKKLGCNVNGCRDKEGAAGGAGAEEEEDDEDEDEDEDDSDDEEDDDFVPDADSEPEEEYNERGGAKVEAEEGAAGAAVDVGGDDSGDDSEGAGEEKEEGEEEEGEADEDAKPGRSMLGKRPLDE